MKLIHCERIYNLSRKFQRFDTLPLQTKTTTLEGIIKVKETAVLSCNWRILNEITFEIKTSTGRWEKQVRESYDTGDGETVLLYNSSTGKVVLTKAISLTNLFKR